MIDVVIPLADTTEYSRRELLYSLRSIEKHLKNFRDIYILSSTLPTYVDESKVKFIQYKDDIILNKERRIQSKFLHACTIADLSNKFIMWNDDYFLTKDLDARKIPYYHSKYTLEDKIRNRKENDRYKHAMTNTYCILRQRQLPVRYFDIHYPMYYDKIKFPQVMKEYDWEKRHGYVVKSLYANTLKVKGKIKKDLKIHYEKDKHKISAMIKEADLFSTKEITRAMVTLLNELYPEKSRFEK